MGLYSRESNLAFATGQARRESAPPDDYYDDEHDDVDIECVCGITIPADKAIDGMCPDCHWDATNYEPEHLR